MKILTITSHISSNALPCFQRNKTGFGYMVRDIITAIAKKDEMDVLVYYYRYGELMLDGARYLRISALDILKYFYLVLPPKNLIKNLRQYPVRRASAFRLIYCWMLTGYFRHIINNGGYDVVHIHGASINNEMWIQLCQRIGQKYVVTLHGLNSFSDTIKIEPVARKYERNFLQKVVIGEIPITVISSGIKRIIEQTYQVTNSSNIFVVLNSFTLDKVGNSKSGDTVRIKYGIPATAKLILYVGNISANKNQVQMARAFRVIDASLQQETYVLFVGNYQEDDGGLRTEIENCQLCGHLVICGGVDKSQISSYYQTADAVVLLSHAEGFGLSLAEGMHFGVPCATFKDLDAFDDLYNPNVMIPIPSRSDADVAASIETLLCSEWDKNSIMEFSKKFESDTMAQDYIHVYQLILGK